MTNQFLQRKRKPIVYSLYEVKINNLHKVEITIEYHFSNTLTGRFLAESSLINKADVEKSLSEVYNANIIKREIRAHTKHLKLVKYDKSE